MGQVRGHEIQRWDSPGVKNLHDKSGIRKVIDGTSRGQEIHTWEGQGS